MIRVITAAVFLVASAPAFAQKAAEPPRTPEIVKSERTLSQFLSAGYEVKGMAGIGGIGFVLQKGASVAVCTVDRIRGLPQAYGTQECLETVR